MYWAILGNTPELSALELGQPYHGAHVLPIAEQPDIQRLGGTVKIAEFWFTVAPTLAGIERIYTELEQVATKQKIQFGFSVYAGEPAITEATVKKYAKQLERIGINWKKQLREQGVSARYVGSREPALTSVMVTREHLLPQQTDFVMVVRSSDIAIGRTIAVQDYKSFSERDYGRPGRDHRSGMLPPKVARMMINSARAKSTDTIFDPFCGSGTILQEALLLGYATVIGSDNSPKAIADTQKNLDWLHLSATTLHVHDARTLLDIVKPQSIDAIVTEGYLGPIRPANTTNIQRELTEFYHDVWQVFAQLVKPGGRIVMALPAWKRGQQIATLDLKQIVTRQHFQQWHKPIFYGREQAQVVRQIVLAEVKK